MENTKTFKQSIDALLAAGQDIKRADDETHYVHVPTGTKLMRTTNFIEAMKPFNPMPEWAGAAPMGSAADQMVRDYFVEGMDYVNEEASKGAYDKLSTNAMIQLASAIRAYDASVVRPQGWKVLADRVFLYSLELGVAGEVDLILYNEKTEEVKIVDMKTVRSPQYISSKLPKYRRQLNTYRLMAEELMGRKVDALEIMWIKTTYEKFDTVSKTAYLHDMMDVDITNVQEEIRTIWMKAKGFPPEDFCFDAPEVKDIRGTSNLIDTLVA